MKRIIDSYLVDTDRCKEIFSKSDLYFDYHYYKTPHGRFVVQAVPSYGMLKNDCEFVKMYFISEDEMKKVLEKQPDIYKDVFPDDKLNEA